MPERHLFVYMSQWAYSTDVLAMQWRYGSPGEPTLQMTLQMTLRQRRWRCRRLRTGALGEGAIVRPCQVNGATGIRYCSGPAARPCRDHSGPPVHHVVNARYRYRCGTISVPDREDR